MTVPAIIAFEHCIGISIFYRVLPFGPGVFAIRTGYKIKYKKIHCSTMNIPVTVLYATVNFPGIEMYCVTVNKTIHFLLLVMLQRFAVVVYRTLVKEGLCAVLFAVKVLAVLTEHHSRPFNAKPTQMAYNQFEFNTHEELVEYEREFQWKMDLFWSRSAPEKRITN